MPIGVQCFDDSGNVIFNTDHRTGTILGAISTGTSNGSYNTGVPISWVVSMPQHVQTTDFFTQANQPSVSVSGTTISWSFPSSPFANCGSVVVFGNA